MINNQLGVKYNKRCKFLVFIKKDKKGDLNKTKYQMVVYSEEAHKVVDRYIDVEKKELEKIDNVSKMTLYVFNEKEKKFKSMTQEEFAKKYIISQKSVEVSNKHGGDKISRDIVFDFLKYLVYKLGFKSKDDKQKYMFMNEKHMNMKMIYGYGLSEKIINERIYKLYEEKEKVRLGMDEVEKKKVEKKPQKTSAEKIKSKLTGMPLVDMERCIGKFIEKFHKDWDYIGFEGVDNGEEGEEELYNLDEMLIIGIDEKADGEKVFEKIKTEIVCIAKEFFKKAYSNRDITIKAREKEFDREDVDSSAFNGQKQVTMTYNIKDNNRVPLLKKS